MSRLGPVLVFTALLAVMTGCDGLFETDNTRLQRGVDAVAEGNYGEAYWAWRPLADRGVAEAQFQLAWLYANGNGLRVDLGKAVEWWRQAAANGHIESEFAIGMAYLNGQGDDFKPNLTSALQWLSRAARDDSEDARELALELLTTNTDKVLKAHSGLLKEPWLGEPLKTAEAGGVCFVKRSKKSKPLADIAPNTVVRKIDEQGSWIQIVAPDDSVLCWAPAAQFAES